MDAALALGGLLLGAALTAAAIALVRPRWMLGGDEQAAVLAGEARLDEIRRQLAQSDARLDASQRRIIELEATRAASNVRADEARLAVEAQKAVWTEASSQLQDVFKALAADALRDSRAELLGSADQLLKNLSDRSQSDMDARRSSIEQLVEPLREAIDAYKREAAEYEEKRVRDLGSVQEQYRELAASASGLREETAKLANALRTPHVRGRWGQLTLRRSAELAGLVEHCDFFEQETVPADGKRLRPDMIVRLPAERLVVVDSKVPLDGYLDAINATSEIDRDEGLKRHARQTRDHVLQLAAKDYQAEFDCTPDFVVAFIPSDSILAAAVDRDPDLLEFALTRGVVIATPSTFFALLRAIAYVWRHERLTANAQRVNALGQQLAERLAVLADHFEKVGGALGRAVEAYNATVSSLEARVLPSARRFRAYGVRAREIRELQQVEVAPRTSMPASPSPGGVELFPDDDFDLEVFEASAEPTDDRAARAGRGGGLETSG
jgi:DNA recombination protein RmuC